MEKQVQRNSQQRSGSSFLQYLPHIIVIIVILSILIALTIYFGELQ